MCFLVYSAPGDDDDDDDDNDDDDDDHHHHTWFFGMLRIGSSSQPAAVG